MPPPSQPVVRAGDLLYVSGIVAVERGGQDVRAQTKQALGQAAALLEASGSSLARAVSVTVYLRQAGDFAAMNEAYRPFWPKDPPVRTTVVAGFAPADALVQIAVIAVPTGAPRQVVHPADWIPSANPYSYAIGTDETLFLAGLVSRNGLDNTIVEGDLAAQTRVVLDNAGAILKAAGLSHADVVSARVYLTDTSRFQEMNAVYREYFPSAPPARATVKAGLMTSQYQIEITLIAVRGSRRAVSDGRPANPNLSAAIEAGRRLYVSGMLGVTGATRGDVGGQTRETLARIERALKAGGYERSHVVDCALYVTNLTNQLVVEEMVAGFFPSSPATTAVEAGLMSGDGLVEIMCTAAR